MIVTIRNKDEIEYAIWLFQKNLSDDSFGNIAYFNTSVLKTGDDNITSALSFDNSSFVGEISVTTKFTELSDLRE